MLPLKNAKKFQKFNKISELNHNADHGEFAQSNFLHLLSFYTFGFSAHCLLNNFKKVDRILNKILKMVGG